LTLEHEGWSDEEGNAPSLQVYLLTAVSNLEGSQAFYIYTFNVLYAIKAGGVQR